MNVLATAQDYSKLEFLKATFANLAREISIPGRYPADAVREGRPILIAASRATIFDGTSGPVIRKYYAFNGDFRRVWFTLDLLTNIPNIPIATHADAFEAKFIMTQIIGLLLNEVRYGLRDVLRI